MKKLILRPRHFPATHLCFRFNELEDKTPPLVVVTQKEAKVLVQRGVLGSSELGTHTRELDVVVVLKGEQLGQKRVRKAISDHVGPLVGEVVLPKAAA